MTLFRTFRASAPKSRIEAPVTELTDAQIAEVAGGKPTGSPSKGTQGKNTDLMLIKLSDALVSSA